MLVKKSDALTSKKPKKLLTPKYPRVFFSCGSLSEGGKYGIGSRGANNARRFGGRYCVIFMNKCFSYYKHSTVAND